MNAAASAACSSVLDDQRCELRSWGEPQYGPRERDLVHLAHAECAWALASS